MLGGKFIHNITDCPASAYCPIENELPKLSVKNFQFEFEAKLTNFADSQSRVIIAIKFRYIDGNNFYTIYFRSDGSYGMNLIYNGQTETLKGVTKTTGLFQGSKLNKYKIVARDHRYEIFFNDERLAQLEDGNLLSEGKISITTQFYTADAPENVTVEYDNFIVTEIK